ncbi:MAG: putative short chain dehydrogenase [Frankiales bacterium]|nr:putative short chain dehydrogenase [Frankiales bacterium]
MAGRFEGKVVVITGTGGGQGRAAALAFAAEGAKVVGCDVKEDGSAETVDMVRAAGGEMTAMAPVDLGDPTAAAAWVDAAYAAYGRIDVLYNNASACRFGGIAQLSIEDWQFTMRNEIDLVFYVTKAAWPYLSERGGVVLNTASVAGHGGADSGIAHTTTKAAVIAMTHCLADAGGPLGIRAVSLSPGPVETPGTKDIFAAPGMTEAMLAPLKVKRLGQPEDVVKAALFFASDDASWITGADLLVDGGMVNR